MRATERTTLHFDLGHCGADREYTLHFAQTDLRLQRHTAQSRARSREAIPVLRVIPDDRLSHYVEADLPSDAIALRWVTTPKLVASGREIDTVVHMAVHIPKAGRDHARSRHGNRAGRTVHPKLALLGVTADELAAALGTGADGIPEFPDQIDGYDNAVDAATALLYHHPNLVNLNMDNDGSVPATIVDKCIQPAITDNVLDLPLQILDEGDAWMTTVDIPGSEAKSNQPSATVIAVATGTLQDAVQKAQNNPDLAGQQWHYEYGTSSTGYDGHSDAPSADGHVSETSWDIPAATASGGWAARVLTPSNGLKVNADSLVYTPPPTAPAWTGSGVWSMNDDPPFSTFGDDDHAPDDTHIADAILAGQAYLQIATTEHSSGLIRGQLVAGGTDPDTGATTLSAKLEGRQVVPPVDSGSTGTATFTVNEWKSGLTYAITVSLDGSAPASASLFLGAPGENGEEVRQLPITNTTGMGSLSLECSNTWLRHLALSVQYLDVNDHPLTPPQWDEQIPDFLRSIYEPNSTKLFLGMLQPVTEIFGVPVPATPTRITVPVWNEVRTVRFLWGGLGRGPYDSDVCPMGIVTTCLAELALPVFLLIAGVAVMNTAYVKSLIADKEVLFGVCLAGADLFATHVATEIETAQNPSAAAKTLAEKYGPMLLSPATSLGRWCVSQISKAAAERAVPFIDVALLVINAAVTASQLAQTTIEVLDSPFFYETDVVRSLTLNVKLLADPGYGQFPDQHDHFTLTVAYDTGTTLPVYTQHLGTNPLGTEITVSFPAIPAGGSLKVFVAFYAENGWQSGQGNSEWIPAFDDQGVLGLSFPIQVNEIPLNKTSVYQHNSKLGLVNNKLTWLDSVGKPPTQTLSSPPPYGTNKEVRRWSGITTTQAPQMAGYCWQATGLNLPPDEPGRPVSNSSMWTMQNISVLEYPQGGWASPKVGFTALPGIAYDMASADDGTGMNLFVDPTAGEFDPDSNKGGGYHVRRITLTHNGPPPVFLTGSNQSYGRFPVAVDRYVYHSQGYVFAISYAAHKLFRLSLTSKPVADADAPQAVMKSGQGDRDGLILGPVALAVALDGRVLVLEASNYRIQAFDLFGKPVQYFANPDYDPADPDSPPAVPTLSLHQGPNATYLDLAVESKGYIYVLSYTGDGSDPGQYQVDLYQPDGTFLASSPNVAAANIAVNLLRAMYTLNYEQILGPDGHVQPSVSKWLPPAPPPSRERAQ